MNAIPAEVSCEEPERFNNKWKRSPGLARSSRAHSSHRAERHLPFGPPSRYCETVAVSTCSPSGMRT